MDTKYINDYLHTSDNFPVHNHLHYGRFIIILLLFIFLLPVTGYTKKWEQYDIVPITFYVPRIGNTEINAIIRDQDAYLPVREIFDFLRIKNTESDNFYALTGFFISAQNTYTIDGKKNQIIYKNQIFDIKPQDLIVTESGLYLSSKYFGEIFNIECKFSFRNLSIALNTTLELPAIREMQQDQIRRNISRFKNEKKADTTISRKFSLFHLGVLDWSVNSLQNKITNNTRIDLTLGAFIAGGETNFYFNYQSGHPLSMKNQMYRWRYVNNDNPYLRQIAIGRTFTQSTSSLYGPLIGVQVSNILTTTRSRTFGSYRLMNKTEPGWVVELYLNNMLIDYTKADALGFYTFDVPMIYGTTAMKLKFYGPYGEERMNEQDVVVPFNFLPPRQLEYSLTAGIVDDDPSIGMINDNTAKSKFSRLNVSYGVSKRFTMGGGVEYLSSVNNGKSMPFINASIRVSSNLILSGEYMHGVRAKSVLNYRQHSNLQAEISYTKYDPNQTAIRTNYLEERKMIVTIPFHGKKYGGFSSLSVSQISIPKFKYTTAELMFAGSAWNINANIKTSAIYSQAAKPAINTNLSFSLRLPFSFRMTPQLQYEYMQKRFSIMRCDFEKPVFKRGLVNLIFERNAIAKTNTATLSFRYNFSFAQVFTSVAHNSKNGITTIQAARGGVMYDDQTNTLLFNDQSNVGRGALTVLPFMDLNYNGRRDANEPRNLELKLNNRMIRNEIDSVIRVQGIEANTHFFVDLDKNSFNNLAYKLLKPTVNVIVDPNRFTPIDVPITVVGEASGTVYLNDSTTKKGLGRIIVCFYKNDTTLIGKTITESDGFFNFLGFPPGTYTVSVDSTQLRKLQMTAIPSSRSFTIRPDKDGDVSDNLTFTLKPLQDTTSGITNEKITNDSLKPSEATRISDTIIHEAPQKTEEIKHKINTNASQIFFETAKSTLLKRSFPPLSEIAKVLQENDTLKLEIQGHTDNIGTIQYNNILSQKRANTVMNYLIKNNIGKERLTAKGYGELKPIASNTTAEGRAKNRRAEMHIIP